MARTDAEIYVKQVVAFFSEQRPLQAVVDFFGHARNSMEADDIAIEPKNERIASVVIHVDRTNATPKPLGVEIALKKDFGLTDVLLTSLFPQGIREDHLDIGGTEQMTTYNPQNPRVKGVSVRHYGPSTPPGELDGFSIDLK